MCATSFACLQVSKHQIVSVELFPSLSCIRLVFFQTKTPHTHCEFSPVSFHIFSRYFLSFSAPTDASHRISDASPRTKSAWAGGQGHPDWERRRAMKEDDYVRQMQKAYKPDLPLKLFLEEEARRQTSAFPSFSLFQLSPCFLN